jgi:hypothetical protein
MQYTTLSLSPEEVGGKMKTWFNRFLCFVIAGITAACIWSCQSSISGTEITNGKCFGIIYNSDSTIASGAVVYLIPFNFNPSQSDSLFDSTLTDNNGYYSFNVIKSDMYNIIAEKGNAACMVDSIALKSEGKTVVDGVLQQSGKLEGTITVKEGDDPRLAIILVRGTGIYTSPSDSTGHFEIPLLPEGNFRVQILFTGESKYASVDTTVEIKKGTITVLNLVLSSLDAPQASGLSVILNDSTMYTTISWLPADTSKIESYVLYRKSVLGNDAAIRIGKSETTYTDDIVELEGDTLHYEIAAIGKTFKEGNRCSTGKISIVSVMKFVKEIDLPIYEGSGESFLINTDGSLIISREYSDSITPIQQIIDKIDSNGIILKSISIIDDYAYNLFMNDSRKIQHDKNGNVYFLFVTNEFSDSNYVYILKKFDSELNLLKEITFISTNFITSFIVSNDGTSYLFATKNHYMSGNILSAPIPHTLTVYNTNFELKKSCTVTLPYQLNNIEISDGLFIDEVEYRMSSKYAYSRIDYWDTRFDIVKSIFYMDTIEKYFSQSMLYMVTSRTITNIVEPDNLFLTYIHHPMNSPEEGRNILLIGNQNKPLLMRRFVEPSYQRGVRFFESFDNAGNFYEIVINDQWNYKIFKYSLSHAK